MSDFKVKKEPDSISGRALTQTPLGELAALHQDPQLTPSPLSAPGPWNNLPPQIYIPKSACSPRQLKFLQN